MLGLQSAAEVILDLRQEQNINIDVLGILPCIFDRTKVSREVYNYLKNKYDQDILPVIRRSAHLAQAGSIGKTIFEHRPKSIGAEDYKKLAKEFLNRTAKRGMNK